MFKISSSLTLAVALSSLDAITATSVPTPDNDGTFAGSATVYEVPDGGKS
jgi:hypothetical protein